VVNGQPYSPKIAIGKGVAGITADANDNTIRSPGSDAVIEALALGEACRGAGGNAAPGHKPRAWRFGAIGSAIPRSRRTAQGAASAESEGEIVLRQGNVRPALIGYHKDLQKG